MIFFIIIFLLKRFFKHWNLCLFPGPWRSLLFRQLAWFQLSHSEPGWFFSPVNFLGPSCCCCSVAKSCLTLYDPMDCNTSGSPVLHHFLEFTQIHVHWVSDVIWPSPPLPPSPLPSTFPIASSVQLLSRVRLFVTPWIAARQASLSITNSRRILKLMSIESVMPSSHLILCRPLLLLPPIPPSIRVFSNESTLHIRWPKYWSFSFSISLSNEHPGLIFRMDQLDLLAVQGTSLRPTQLQVL